MQFCRLRSWESVTCDLVPAEVSSVVGEWGQCPHHNLLVHPGRSENFPSQTSCLQQSKVQLPLLECSNQAHTRHTPVLWAAQLHLAAGERDPSESWGTWQAITGGACIIPLSCPGTSELWEVAQMISWRVQLASVCGADRMAEVCAVSWTKDVPVSLMSSTSTKHILSKSVWRKTSVS